MGFPMTVERVIARNHIDPASMLADDIRRLHDDTVTLALPAAAPSSRLPQEPTAAEGQDEGWALLRALVEALDAMAGKVNIRGTAPDSVDLGLAFDAVAEQARAALARHESAGSE